MQAVALAFEIAKVSAEKVGESTQNVNDDKLITPQSSLYSFENLCVKGHVSRKSENSFINMLNATAMSDTAEFEFYLY